VSERLVRLFVSSPNDVRPERDRVVTVADRLNGEFKGIVRIQVIRWEDEFYSSTQSFQEQIDGAIARMAQIDILICILWGKIGLKLNPGLWHRNSGEQYESGTSYEYETALALSKKHGGVPDLYLFRKSAPILYRAESAAEDAEQHHNLEMVWKRWTESGDGYNAAGFQIFARTDEFEQQIEKCLLQWLERQGVIITGPVWDRRLKGSPFRGLAPFDSSHSSVFFGRDAAITAVTAKVRAGRFLLIIGASGTGKSSLLRAGIVPRIAKPGSVPGVDLWRPATVTAGEDTLLAVAQALAAETCLGPELQEANCTIERLAELLRQGGDPILTLLKSALAEAARRRAVSRGYDKPRPARLLLAVDQLERLFVEARPEDANAFAVFLRGLIAADIALVIATLRADSYGSFQAVEAFTALREAGAIHDLLPPTVSELEDIVGRPVSACFPPLAFGTVAGGRSLAETLVNDARGGDALPLLQMTLEHLFECEKARGDGVLSASDYGGIDQAVIQVASEAFGAIDDAARASVPALITAFAHDLSLDPTSGKPVITLRPVVRAAFERGLPERKALVEAFLTRRLLTVEDIAGEIRVRPVHEALLRVWPEAVQILTESEIIIRVRRTIEPLVAQWVDAGSATDSDLLLTSPALLAGSRQLVGRLRDDVTEPMRDYIAASAAADERRREFERQRRSTIMSATGGMRASSIPYYRPLVLALIALAIVVRVADPPSLERLRLFALDTYQRVTPREQTMRPVVIVDIDEQSLKTIGQWPWPRTLLADLITRISQLGAVVIGMDILFPEPDRMSPGIAADSFRNLDDETRAKLKNLPSNDEIFAAAIKKAGAVVSEAGAAVATPMSKEDVLLLTGYAVLGGDARQHLVHFPGLLRNVAPIEAAAAGHGLVSLNPELDGVTRRLPIVMVAQDMIVQSLPLEMLRVVTKSAAILLHASDAGLMESVRLPGLHIPTDEHGQYWVYFNRSDPARYVSAADVLQGNTPADRFRGRVVLIGTSAFGLRDYKFTPGGEMPGVEVHAQLLENILTRAGLVRPGYALGFELVLGTAILLILSFVMARLSARAIVVTSVVVLAGVAVGGWAFFRYESLLLDPAYPAAALATFIVVITLLKYAYSEAQRSSIRRAFDPAADQKNQG
jgi:CHASE2 domain-containing sensor protein